MVDDYVLKRTTTRVLLAVVLWSVFFVSPSFAGRRYAVVVAVSEIDSAPGLALPYVEIDALTTIKTLKNLDFEVYAFCEDLEDVERAGDPTRENVLKFLRDELSERVGENDVVFLYVSSHGRVLNGKTFLFAKNTTFVVGTNGDSEIVPTTAIAARELRETAGRLRTKRVFLALDACESAGVRAPGYRSVLNFLRAEDDFEVATLASCAANQKSGAIVRRDGTLAGQPISHFTYWLNEGLKQYADEDANGKITTDELARYVQFNATYASDLLIAREKAEKTVSTTAEQTPIVVASENCEPFTLAEIEPRKRVETLDEVAEQVATCLYATAKKNKTRELSLFVGVAAPLSAFDSEPARDAAAAFRKSFGKKIKTYLQTKLRDVGVEIKFVAVPSSKEDVPEFRCVIKPADDSNESAYRFSGRLIGLKNADGSPAPDYGVDARIAFDLETKARSGEGVDDDFSDAISVWLEVVKTNGRVEKRFPREIDGALWVPLDVGEKYRVVYNFARTPKSRVGVRALVDGRNTLEQFETYVSPKYVATPPPSETPGSPKEGAEEEWEDRIVRRPAPEERFQPLVALDEARFWVASKRGAHPVKGFYRRTKGGNAGNSNAVYAPFVVASNDETSERNDAIGSILLAFYRLTPQRTPGPTDVRTVPDKERPTSLIRVEGLEIAEEQEPFACFSIRYASSKELERFRRDPNAFYAEQDYVYY